MPLHRHLYFSSSLPSGNHKHYFKGDTNLSIGGMFHTHVIQGVTDTAEGHFHTFKLKTGFPIHLSRGEHMHYFWGTTETEDGHIHYITGYVFSII